MPLSEGVTLEVRKPPELVRDVDIVIGKLLAYCRKEDWAGYDPYDALNSRLFQALPFLDKKWCRLAITQALKRSPVNVRRLALVPKTQNPKTLALLIAAFLRLPLASLPGREELVQHMIRRLKSLRSPESSYWCWGYNFPWQGRKNLVPRWAANMVCTTFVADSLLDVFEKTQNSQALEMAVSAARYILDRLYWSDREGAGFSYPVPSLRSEVHNANLLGAALFCRIYRHSREERFRWAAMSVARHSARRQLEDGAWYYGEALSQKWIDNFHTGYNLVALQTIGRELDISDFQKNIEDGFAFYRTRFFRDDSAPRYFHDRDYPIDIHCVAQSILTLVACESLAPDSHALAEAVFRWAMAHMWNDQGFFYYRVLRYGTIRTSYMRWSQAWMLFALSTLRSSLEPTKPVEHIVPACLICRPTY